MSTERPNGGEERGSTNPRMSVLSTARRRPIRRRSVAATAIVLVAGIIALIVLVNRPEPPVAPPPVPTVTPPPTAVPASPSPTPSPSPTATPETVGDTVWVPLDEATPTPWPTLPPFPTPTPRRTAAPSYESCLHYTARAHQSVAAWGQILVDIELENECGRDFEPLDIWFEIMGYRDGAVVQTVRGHPFFRVEDGHSAHLSIGLPGSLDWYDDVEVRLIPPEPGE